MSFLGSTTTEAYKTIGGGIRVPWTLFLVLIGKGPVFGPEYCLGKSLNIDGGFLHNSIFYMKFMK